MDERLKFVARLLDGEKMAVLCREFDISRKTGYNILTRYNDSGLEGLTDRSRRPYRHANQLPFQIEKLIVRPKQDKPTWGAPKIRERLADSQSGHIIEHKEKRSDLSKWGNDLRQTFRTSPKPLALRKWTFIF